MTKHPERKTITIGADLHADLADLKRDDESWGDLLRRLADETEGGQDEHRLNTLTEDHIDDIASLTARRTVEELETRRR